MSKEKLSGQQVADAGLTGWSNLAGALRTRIDTGDFATALAVVNAIGAAAEEMNHHPDLDLRYGRVDVSLSSHDVGGLTERDLALARKISEIAAGVGAEVSSAGLSVFELALDTPDQERIAPFWEAVLGREISGDELPDPTGSGPFVWFQTSGATEPRQRWHVDRWVDPGEVQQLIDAAVAAGGTLAKVAPSYYVLADPEGNNICLCTWQGR